MRYDFPGNVRELENLIEFAFVLCHNRQIDIDHLPEDFLAKVRKPSQQDGSTTPASGLKLAEAETIESTLRHTAGHIGQAARELGISRTTLWRKMKKYAIQAERFRHR
jgi:DNA-binding NtrC family response regulator